MIGVLIKGLFQKAAGLASWPLFFVGIVHIGTTDIILDVYGADFPFESLW